jgi:hypothetical protein
MNYNVSKFGFKILKLLSLIKKITSSIKVCQVLYNTSRPPLYHYFGGQIWSHHMSSKLEMWKLWNHIYKPHNTYLVYVEIKYYTRQ